MKTYTLTAWKEPIHYATIDIEAENVSEALQKGVNHDWSGEIFEDCGDWGDVTAVRAHLDQDDGTTEEEQQELSTAHMELERTKAILREIRHVVGNDPREMDEDSGVEFDCVSDVNAVIDILNRIPATARED